MSKNGHDSNDGGNDRQEDTQQEDNSQADFHGNRPERQEGATENQTPSQRLSNDLSVEDYRQFQGDRQWGIHRDASGDLVFESSSIYGNQGNGHGRDHHHRDGDRHNDDGTVTLENGNNDVKIDKDGNITIQMDGHDNNGHNRELKIGKDGKVTLPNGEEVDADKILKDRDHDGQTDLNEIMQNSEEAEAATGSEATDRAADNAAGTPTATTSDGGAMTTTVSGSSDARVTVNGDGLVILDDGRQTRQIQAGAVVGQEGQVAQLMSQEQVAQQFSPEALEQRARLNGDVAGVAPDGRDTNGANRGVTIADNGALQWSPGNGQQVTMQDGNITIRDGDRSVTIRDGQIAMSNGAAPVTALPDGSMQFTFADGTKMIRGTDGSVTINSDRNGNYYFPRGEQGAASQTV